MSQIDNDAEYAKKAGEAAGAYVSQNAGASARIFKVLGL